MRELKAGDRVLTADSKGKLIFDEVYFFGHAEEKLAPYVKLQLQRLQSSSAAPESLELSPDHYVLKRYLKLLEDDGNYFVDLIKACKDKLLEVAPKEYYLLYPRSTHVAAVTLVAVLTLCRADGTELHSCGVSRPLFKDTSIKVEPIDSHNWLQQGISAVLGWVNQLRPLYLEAWAVLIWSMAAAGLAFFVYVPYAEYVTGFLNEAGKFPQGFMMGLLGFLIGLTWWAMCMMIGTCVNIAGFQTIEDENLFIFIFFTIFCVAASAFNVYLTWYYTQEQLPLKSSDWREYCTSNKLDSMVLYFGWGLLLAELAACHAYWRVRLQEWQWISILQSVIMSYAIYWTFLWLLGVPWPLRLHGELDVLERSRERSDDDRCQSCEDFCYNWLNVNPVYVLKSQYCETDGDPMIFYEPGTGPRAEYLQLAPTDETCVQNTSNQRWKMASSGLWLELEGLGCIGIAPFLDSEVCGEVVQSPVDRLQEEGLLARHDDVSEEIGASSGLGEVSPAPAPAVGFLEEEEAKRRNAIEMANPAIFNAINTT
eukprot:g2686.t1